MTTAKDDTVASKAEDYVLLGDPEKTTALPDLPKTTEPADKQNKTTVADANVRGDSNKQDKTVEATHAATLTSSINMTDMALIHKFWCISWFWARELAMSLFRAFFEPFLVQH